jgi:hypothetical protein
MTKEEIQKSTDNLSKTIKVRGKERAKASTEKRKQEIDGFINRLNNEIAKLQNQLQR